jgi:hypothetical protein
MPDYFEAIGEARRAGWEESMSNQTPFQRMVRTMMAVLVTQAMEDLAVECGYESFYEPAADDHCPAVTISPMRSESQ